MDLDKILEGNPPTAEEKAHAPAKDPTQTKEQPRDESGKFAKGEEKPAPKEKPAKLEPEVADAAPPAAPEIVQAPPDPQVSAFLAKAKDETAKRQRLEKELEQERQRNAEYARRVAEFEAQHATDMTTDPQGHLAYLKSRYENDRLNEKLNLSESYARRVLGDDAVAEAQQAFIAAVQSKPYLYQQMVGESDPYGFVVSWHKREKLLAEIGDDPEAYRQKILAGAQQPAAPVQNPTPLPPPRSLASATGARVSEPALAAEHKPLKDIFRR